MTTTQVRNDGLLRFALKLDGVGSGGLGLLALLFDLPTGLPRGLVIGLGVFLLAYGVGVFALGLRPVRALVAVVIIGNSVWVLDSFLTAFAGWFPVTGLGVFLIVAQAVGVMGFITLQVLGLRRSA
ncbi:hypothetical protein ADK67_46590 [Saccharothrix sp. NRRL B-16348]|uniref:hypothetical protein n=1 Tax=Saccharothrix sp. NRRL B-16348 TaxID=1415542 RepID=UPI0006C61897|nr:hypothetical protein [Saccharothrix sp. NRRL B-16348]KOX12700.1 hypothetical protein ADK67_46590 [Saccharothrix sp. NRRL B-16348]